MPTSKELQQLTDFAVTIAVESGRMARQYFRTSALVTNKSESDFDPVTEADRRIEKFLRKKIHDRYPRHNIIGEEHGSTIKGGSYTWIIDPIDGTRGFVSGSPMWGTLIGVSEGDTPLLGLMHQPYIRETFFANLNGAWWKRGKLTRKIATRTTSTVADAILYCTHPSMFANKTEQQAFRRVESNCQYSRFGGDCYGYCLLAAGFVDLVIEADLKPYDIIPLIPLIESAGGVITDWAGRSPLNGGKILAAGNRQLHRAAMALLND
jgi:histidinol phosphatase-like enzyme (inositol monophosphatase family)